VASNKGGEGYLEEVFIEGRGNPTCYGQEKRESVGENSAFPGGEEKIIKGKGRAKKPTDEKKRGNPVV